MNKTWKFLSRNIKKIDKLLLLAILSLSALSVILLYSIYSNGVSSYVYTSTYKTQFIAAALGTVGALFITFIDYSKLAKFWYIYGVGAVALVLLTFTSLGAVREGTAADDRAWLDIGITTIQPSEFLKVAFILTFAYHVSKISEKINEPLNILLLILHMGFVAGLISLQGDQGTAIVFVIIFVCVMFVGGLQIRYFVSALVALPIFAFLAWNFLLQDHHKDRILILFNPESDPRGVGMQQMQSKIAVGSGQIFGKGLSADNYSYVSEVHNDFIFSFVGQALGFIGCIAVCLVYTFIMIKIIVNGMGSKDLLGKLVCTGVFGMFFTHVVLNIGMVLGVMPVIGIPLPFLSAGGTSSLSMYLAMGLVLSVHCHSEKNTSVLFY